MTRVRLIAAVILSLLALVFIVQNTEVVEVRMLFWDLSMSRVILIVLTLLVGFLLGFLVSSLGKRRARDDV